jgi:hypothetical protein
MYGYFFDKHDSKLYTVHVKSNPIRFLLYINMWNKRRHAGPTCITVSATAVATTSHKAMPGIIDELYREMRVYLLMSIPENALATLGLSARTRMYC